MADNLYPDSAPLSPWSLGENMCLELPELLFTKDELDDVNLAAASPNEIIPMLGNHVDPFLSETSVQLRNSISTQPHQDVQMGESPPPLIQVPGGTGNRKRKARSTLQRAKPKLYLLNPSDFDDEKKKKSIIKSKQCKLQRERRQKETEDRVNSITAELNQANAKLNQVYAELNQANAEKTALKKENLDLKIRILLGTTS